MAFTEADVEALQLAVDLTGLGILGEDSQAALVRTWGRSFARLAEWQTTLMARVASAEPDADPAAQLGTLTAEVIPRVERLQSYVWRRHLAGAAGRLLAGADSATTETSRLAVAFVDIVGFTSQSRSMADAEPRAALRNRGFLVMSTLDGVLSTHQVLLVADTPADAARIVHLLVSMGADDDDPFPQVRAGVAYGDVVTRLGDVLGPTVNIAARLTSLARPGTVLVDDGMHDALEDDSGFSWRRLQRTSVKGYSRLQPWVLRRRED